MTRPNNARQTASDRSAQFGSDDNGRRSMEIIDTIDDTGDIVLVETDDQLELRLSETGQTKLKSIRGER